MNSKLLKNKDDDSDLVYILLKLPWSHSFAFTEPYHLWKTKCISIQVACKLGHSIRPEIDTEILDLGLHDETEEVRHEAVISMPVVVFWSGLSVLSHIFRRLE